MLNLHHLPSWYKHIWCTCGIWKNIFPFFCGCGIPCSLCRWSFCGEGQCGCWRSGRNFCWGCRGSGWLWTSYFPAFIPCKHDTSAFGANISAQPVLERIGFIEHCRHWCYTCDVTPKNISVERPHVRKHVIHQCYARDVLPQNIPVETVCVMEHCIHQGYARDVPPGNIRIETPHFFEHAIHQCYTRDVPRTKIFVKCTISEHYSLFSSYTVQILAFFNLLCIYLKTTLPVWNLCS